MNQSLKRSVFLVGPMGSGKTAVGRQLARLLRARFIDADAELAARTGVEIPVIFEKEGEAGFRDRERELLDELTQAPGIVLSTGGGAVLSAETRERLNQRGVVVYLKTSVATQVARVRAGRNRPMLAGVDPAARLAELMVLRAPLYEEVAHLTVPTDGRRVRAVADDIVRALPPP